MCKKKKSVGPPLNAVMGNRGEGMESKGSPIWATLVGSKQVPFPSQELDCGDPCWSLPIQGIL